MNVEKLIYRANCFCVERKYSIALRIYEKILKSNPNNKDAHRGKKSCLFGLKRYDKLIAICDKTLKIDPKNFRVIEEKISCLRNLGKHKQALKLNAYYLKIRPYYFHALFDRGIIAYQLKKYSESIKAFNLALHRKANGYKRDEFHKRDLGYAHVHMGNAWKKLGKNDKAKDEYVWAMQAWPRKDIAFFMRIILKELDEIKKTHS